jgi:hypothetical protein
VQPDFKLLRIKRLVNDGLDRSATTCCSPLPLASAGFFAGAGFAPSMGNSG